MAIISTDDLNLELNESGLSPLSKWVRSVTNTLLLLQPLELGQFIPCDLDGNVLEYPMTMDYRVEAGSTPKYPTECYTGDLEQYQQAQERVLFKGFRKIRFDNIELIVDNKKNEISDWTICICAKRDGEDFEFNLYKTIQDLIGLGIELINNVKI